MSLGLGLEMNGIIDLSDRVSFTEFSWEEILGSPGTANVTLEFLDETVFIERLADMRIYKGSFNLFRGRCSVVELERIGEAVRAHLTLDDWNILFDLVQVGAPDGFTFYTQADGTNIAVDPNAVNFAAPHHYMSNYWPLPGLPPGIDLDTFNTAPQPPSSPVRTDRLTALTTLRAVMDDDAARVSGAVRYWVDPDYAYHWQEITPSDYIVAPTQTGVDMTLGDRLQQQYVMLWPVPLLVSTAPYILGDRFDPDNNVILPMVLRARWDDKQLREQVYVRGSTVPGSGYVTSVDAGVNPNVAGGREYLDAPGSITEDDKLAIGIWNFRQNYRELLTGSATVSPGFDGWRVGQTVQVSDESLSHFYDHDLTDRILTIQRVRGTLRVPGENPAEIGGSADIEYDLDFGDIPAGSLARQMSQIPEPEPPAVVYKFKCWADDPGMPDGGTSRVTAQMTDAAGAEVKLAGVPMEWVTPIYQFEDNAQTVVGTLFTLTAPDPPTDFTDAAGCAFGTVTRSGNPSPPSPGDIYNWQVAAESLPIT